MGFASTCAHLLEVFLDSSDLMPTMQSVYRRFHSTETAVMKVYNDLLLAADNVSSVNRSIVSPEAFCHLRVLSPFALTDPGGG